MPFKSKAQRRWMYWAESHGKVPKGTASEWESHTGSKKLPERVGKSEIENWIKSSSELDKSRPTPKFPKLGLPDDRRETPLINTQRQLDIKTKAMANQRTLHIPDPMDRKFGNIVQQDKAKESGRRVMGMSQPKANKDPGAISFAKDYPLRPHDPQYPQDPKSPIGTKLHEDLHNMFVRVGAKYGQQARFNLAHNLYHSIPLHHKQLIEPAIDRFAAGSKPHYMNEERLAHMISYLNDPLRRQILDKEKGASVLRDDAIKAGYRHINTVAPLVHEGWVKNKIFDENGRRTSFEKHEDLEKGWKGSTVGALAGLAGLAGQFKAPTHTPQAPHTGQASISQTPPAWEPPKFDIPQQAKPVEQPKPMHPVDMFEGLHPDLNYISFLESSHGKNMNHAPSKKGDFYTAFGHLGFKPVSAYDFYSKNKGLEKQYPNYKTSDLFLKQFKSDPKFYNAVASQFWDKLKHSVGGDAGKAAFAWRWGLGAARKATQEQIDNDGYVKKFREMYAKGGLHKSEDFNNELQIWLGNRSQPDEYTLDYAHEDSTGARDAAEKMQYRPDRESLLEAARFLAQKPHPPDHIIVRSFDLHEDDPYTAALEAFELPTDRKNIDALKAILSHFSEVSKAENLEQPKEIKALKEDGVDVAQAVQRAYAVNKVTKTDLGGKHSKNSLLALDPETKRAYILKPDDHKTSPALGVSDTPVNQAIREAVYYDIAMAWGLTHTFPRAEAINIDGTDYAAIKLLPPEYVNMDELKQENIDLPKQILQPYLDRGTIYKWAAVDWILGQPDRHDGNLMADPINGQVVLIDQGSSLAGKHFNPGNDKNSFVPFYLRAWALKGFSKKTPVDRLKVMPKLDPEIDKEIHKWVNNLNEKPIIEYCGKYNINPQPFLDRLAKLKSWSGPIYILLNRLWAGV